MGQSVAVETSHIPEDQKVGIWSASFWGLLMNQGLGVFNDNMFKWFSTFVGIHIWNTQAAVLAVGAEKPDYKELALSIGSAMFVLPYVLFAAPAGFLADKFSKTRVLLVVKFFEVLVMLVGMIAIGTQQPTLIFACIFLLGTQACFMGPAKMGGLPELLKAEALPVANGIANLATMVAILTGTIAGYGLYEWTAPDGLIPLQLPGMSQPVPAIWVISSLFLGLALLGFGVTFLVKTLPAAAPQRPFPLNPFGETFHDLKLLFKERSLRRVALGAAYFWTLACLAQLNINTYAIEELGIDTTKDSVSIGLLMASIALGVSVGSVLAGVWSRGRIEMGMVPFAALGISVSALFLYTSTNSYPMTAFWLFSMGVTAGLYDVPLMAYLQKYSSPAERGQIFAANNFLCFFGMMCISGLFYLISKPLHVPPRWIFVCAGLVTIPVGWYIFRLVPDYTMKFITWLMSHFFYRVRLVGIENIPETGGCLLVSNHVSFADGILIGVHSPRIARMIAFDGNLTNPLVAWLSRTMRTIPINAAAGPKALVQSLQAANQALKDGDVVCIFAEGAITRTGQLQPFQRGIMKIVEGTNCPIVPVYLDGLWGSIFSFEGKKFFNKWPKRLRYPVTIMFGKPITNPRSTFEVRQKVEELGADAVQCRRPDHIVLPRRFLRTCRNAPAVKKVADSNGQSLTGSELLLKSLVACQILKRQLAVDEQFVGLLLPPSVGGVVANAALSLLKRTPVNLNYTIAPKDVQEHLKVCGIKHVITSRKFQEKLNFPLETQFLFLEDFASTATGNEKVIGYLQARWTPMWILERWLGLTAIKPDDLATIIFTSGSTGEPKGVMLSYFNIATNIEAIDQLFSLKSDDCLFGVLPFFHSFGFTATLWSVLTLPPRGIYHFNPLDARTIGQMAQEHRVTFLMCTPTFMRMYLKRCDKEQFAHLKLAVTGAEKLPLDLAQAFAEKFGVMPSEGYGTTELSPLVSVNVPDHVEDSFKQIGTKLGTVGRPVPGVTAKTVDPDTGKTMGADEPGLLLIRGPNVMQGYLNRLDKTKEVINDGWYNTGDMAKIDADGFITITDRLSRFSKIGGEMVPHLKIEEALSKILALPDDQGPELRAVVTAIPDSKKGERLIVIHKPVSKTSREICEELAASGLPNLWLPAADSFLEIEEIPILGTGKLDLKGLKKLALEKFSVT